MLQYSHFTRRKSMSRLVIVGVCAATVMAAVGWGIYSKKDTPSTSLLGTSNLKVIRGIITSEKESFFRDPQLAQVLQEAGFKVEYERWGSSKIANMKNTSELGQFSDFVFPPGVQTSDNVKKNIPTSQVYNVFYSPMVIATWEPIVDILQKSNLVKTHPTHKTLDMTAFFKLSSNKVKWKDLPGSGAYPVNKNVLIYTSELSSSNAAKMYVALSSYIYNNSDVVQNYEQVNKVTPSVSRLLAAQGHKEASSTNLLADYTAIGMGKAPMIFSYESELIEYAVKNSGLADSMSLLYPSPSIFTKHSMVNFTPAGAELTRQLQENPKIKDIAAKYGFRFAGNNALPALASSYKINVASQLVDVIDPPSYDVLEDLIKNVQASVKN